MSENPKSLGRVPVIPLSYDNRERAVTKELIADYETGNIYIKNANGELINVFQAALKVDNQWITAAARLNNGRAWNVTAGNANNALVAAGTNSNSNTTSNIKVVDSIEAWDGATWKVDSIEDFGVSGISYKRYVGGCGTRDSMLFARTGAVYKYENSTATLLTTSGIPSDSFDVCGNSTQALFRNYGGVVSIFNSITKAFTSLGTITDASVSQTLSEESFGGVNGAIIIGNKTNSNVGTNYTVKYDGTTFSTLVSPNIYRNRFGAAGENTSSGIIFGGCTNSNITNYDYIGSTGLESITNTTEEWINGSTWKVSSNMEYGLAAIDGCGTARGGIAMGGFLSDGSVSTYTERFSNVDGLTYLKSIRDDMSAVIDAISDKTIGSTFDSFLSTNSSVSANDIIGMPGIGTKQEKATISTLSEVYSYSKLTKSLTTLDSFITLLESASLHVFTSGISDDADDYLTNQDTAYTSKRNGITTTSLSFNPFQLSRTIYGNTSLEHTGAQIGIGKVSHSSSTTPAYFKYDFDNQTSSSLSIYPLIARAAGFGGGTGVSLAYFVGGRTHNSSLYYINAEKIANNTVSAIGNCSAYHANVYGGQSNMMKYGNDFVVYGNTIEKLNTLTDTWSTENYKSAYTTNYCATNGNTSALGLGAAIVSGSGACFEELYHGGVLETIEDLLSANSTNMNTEKAEKIESGDSVNIDYVAATKDGSATTVLVDTEQFFKILCEDTQENIADYTGFTLSQNGVSNLIYETYLITEEYEYDDEIWYDCYMGDNFSLSSNNTLGDRIRSLENLLIRIVLGNYPSNNYYLGSYTEGGLPDDATIAKDYNLRKALLDYIVSDDSMNLSNLINNHTYGYYHPDASSSNRGYMSSTHWSLLNNATYSATSGSTLVRRSSGKFYTGTPSYAASSYYVVNCTYVYNYFIRNSSTGSSPSTTQTLGTMLQAVANTNYTTRQVRNIVFWTSGTIPTTQNGDIIIKTF